MALRSCSFGCLTMALLIVLGTWPVYAVPPGPLDQVAVAPQGLTVSSASLPRAVQPTEAQTSGLYILQLAAPPLASYHGGQASLAGTSLAVTGERQLDLTSAASRSYLAYLDQQQQTVLEAINTVVGQPVQPVATYRYVINGFALPLTPAQAATVATLPGVVYVEPNRLAQLHTDRGPNFIGATQANGAPLLFNATLAGSHEVPPVTTAAAGEAIFSYDATTRNLSYRVTFRNLSGPLTLAQIHFGAAGVNGGIVLDLLPDLVGPPATSGALVGQRQFVDLSAPLNKTAAQIEAALYAGQLYLNLYTATNPGGEVRSQISPAQGEGMRIGVLDTGINPSNPNFQDVGGDGYDHTNPLGSGVYLGVCDPGNASYDASFPCNDKLIGAYTFPSTADSPDPNGLPSPRDDDGHGSHTASTAGGNVVITTTVGADNTGRISGVAPHANLVIYDVCNADGCPIVAIIAALEQAVADHVDVVNLSLGSTSTNPWLESSALALARAVEAGVANAVSAGNEGPAPATIGSSADAPWALGVAASTHDRGFANRVANFSGGSAANRPAASIVGKGISDGITSTLTVYAGDPAISNPLCNTFTPTQTALITGKIVLCDRGEIGRLEKAFYVQDAGGVGYILANDADNGTSLIGDDFPIPGVHISYADGQLLKVWLNDCSDCRTSITGSNREVNPFFGDVLASFSSRGPNPSVPGILKPNLSAPGVDILAATADSTPGPDYEFMSGTSMSAPHVAGAVALLRQLHPDWSVSEINSALSTTANAIMLKEDEVTPADPLDMGTGRIQVDQAAWAGLVLNETSVNFAAADPELGGNPSALNLASAASDACFGQCNFVRTVRSTLAVSATWTARVQSSPGMTLTVSPNSFSLAPGATQTFTISADVRTAAIGDYRFGRVTFATPAINLEAVERTLAPPAAFPVAVRPLASTLPTVIDLPITTASGSVTQTIRALAISDLVTETYGLVKATPQRLSLPEDPTTDDLTDVEEGGIYTTSLLMPQGSLRAHISVDQATARDLDLYVFLDSNGNGTLEREEEEIICRSASQSAAERCEISAENIITGQVEPLNLAILVQNYAGSDAPEDSFTLYTAVLGRTNTGGLTVSGPNSTPLKVPFGLNLAWDLAPTPTFGDRYIGLFSLGTVPTTPGLVQNGDLGYARVTFFYQPVRVFLPFTAR